MKKVFLSFSLLIFSFSFCYAQFKSIDSIQNHIQGLWQNKVDNANRLIITTDSITVVTPGKEDAHYAYKLSGESCSEDMIVHGATNVFIMEQYKDKTICCAIDQMSSSTLRLAYPDGKKVEYRIKSDLPH